MKASAILVLAVAGLGCSSAAVPAGGNLAGARDLVQIDNLLFTTSTDRDELRVLDVVPPGQNLGVRAYVRAPNPLEALSIPVLKGPSALSRDTRYEDFSTDAGTVALGNEVGGPWVYATRAGGAELSVVGGGPASDRAQLVEAKRIATAQAVTASAGVRVSPQLSRLFFATSAGDSATLLSIDLPTTPAALKAAKLKQVVIGSLPGEVVVDLVVVPGIATRSICADPARSCIVFATRRMQGRAGRVVLFDPETRAEKELRFPAPVRLLEVHAGTFIENVYFAPGRRVFGVLDEEQCGGSQCNGVAAVDTVTGELAVDAAGLPMLPISVGNSLPAGLTVVPRGRLLLPPELVRMPGITQPTVVELSALGVITTSTGAFVFFDAAGLTGFDVNRNRAAVEVQLVGPDGAPFLTDAGTAGYVEGPRRLPGADAGFEIFVAEGAWNEETVDIVVKGLIPGLIGVPLLADGGSRTPLPDGGSVYRLEVPPELIANDQVLVGDLAVFFGAPGDTAGDCAGTITDVILAGTAPNLRRALLAPAPCSKATGFGVRANGTLPYVVTSSRAGLLGRAGPNGTFSIRSPYLEHVVQLDVGGNPLPFDSNAATMIVTFGPEVPSLPVDARWVLDINPNRTPFSLRLDPQSVGCSTHLASSVVYDLPRQAIFSVFPSASAIIEVNPLLATSGLKTNVGQCWR